MIGYQYIKKNTKNGVYLQIWKDGKMISEHKQEDKKKWNTPSNDHQETIRDDLGLFSMLNNFDKVREKIDKGQKEVYQDGWSIAPIGHKISDDIPNKTTEENPFGWKWVNLREIPEEKEEEKNHE